MQKNIIYIIVPVILLVLGLVYRFFFLADSINETASVSSENKILMEKYNRDVFIQNNISNIKAKYEINKRGSSSYGDIIVELLGVVENMLKDSKITYEANRINQDPNEINDPKSGTATFIIIMSFETGYDQMRDFINRIEKSDHVINIAALRINRNKVSAPKNMDTLEKDDFDEFNVKSTIQCDIRLEFVKFL
ncbi:MAG: hypothetical protein JXR69_11130 [Candidatus Delongbacteria bacterium]|nr:hypothetical protein [Candidatus Delongbacteria bacterium]